MIITDPAEAMKPDRKVGNYFPQCRRRFPPAVDRCGDEAQFPPEYAPKAHLSMLS